jgi:hypothetical protein
MNEEIQYLCDNYRHLICKPYSIENLHKMAKDLNIKMCWFHNNHYDIPKKRIEEIKNKCKIISSKEIVKIIKEHENNNDK